MENNFIFFLGIAFIISAPIIARIKPENYSASKIIIVAGLILIFTSKIDTMEEFSVGPLQAKMKETIQEANATIKQLKTVSAASAKTTLTGLMADGFLGGLPLKRKIALHDQIIESLREVGFSNQEISEADEMWRKGVGILYYNKIRPLIEGRESPNLVNRGASEEARKATHDFTKLLDFENWLAPTPEQITIFLEERGFLKPEMEEWIADYQHYLDTGEIRRRDLFAQR